MAAKPLRTALLAATLILLPLQASATLSKAMSFDDKVQNAQSIILGKVIRSESRWDGAHRWILTYTTFRIEKSLKGFPAQEITVVTPGGSVDGIRQETIGVPQFREDEEHVLFVRNSQAGPTVLYFDQGAYDVVTVRGERIVQPAVSSAVLIDTQRGMAVSPEGPRTLREFESSVRESIRRREANRMEMLEREKREQTSISNVLKRNRILVLLALAGALLATWQLVKRW
ncbi:MAG TPA: hypothetical protein VNA69_12980 [Thermoanaerobaculia bacterium]|nr:hypothetical protein [Thermoanaerobaculia bacterium]